MPENAQELKINLLAAQVRRLERALAELAGEIHGVSRPTQLAGKGLPSLAAIVSDQRAGMFEHATSLPEETR